MAATKLTSRDKELDANHVFDALGGLRLLKSAAVYGANGSGKSNLRAAIWFMRYMALNSSRESQADEQIDVSPFLLIVDEETSPSFFEIVFIAEDIRYRYGFEVNSERVVSEWLYHVPTSREAMLFTRTDDVFETRDTFREGLDLAERTRKNSLFLSVCAQFNGKISTRILRWFRNMGTMTGVQDELLRNYTTRCLEKGTYTAEINQFLAALDLGFDEIRLEDSLAEEALLAHSSEANGGEKSRPLPRQALTRHTRHSRDGTRLDGHEWFRMDSDESEGTRKLFALSGAIHNALDKGMVVVIDEFDARLHPLITRAIVQLFNSNVTNPKNAQLVFMTHDTNLLDLRFLRRDQVWFVEKDRRGSSHLYSLAEFQVRNDDASVEQDYIQGRFGAIPFLGGVKHLMEPANAAGK
jgi:hypothetical protein